MSKQHPVDTAESRRLSSTFGRSIPRRQVLKLGAAGAALSALSPMLAAEAFARDPKEKPKGFPVYAPVPQSALGPALNGLGVPRRDASSGTSTGSPTAPTRPRS